MDDKRKQLMAEADELGCSFSKFWTTERIELTINNHKADLTQRSSAENSLGNKGNGECPSDACQELQDQWNKTVTCFSETSRYCITCQKDFPNTYIICQTKSEGIAAKAVAKERKSGNGNGKGRVKVGFGHVDGTQAAKIDLCLLEGMTKEKIIEALQPLNDNKLDNATLWQRIKRHFDDLRKCHSVVVKRNEQGFWQGEKPAS